MSVVRRIIGMGKSRYGTPEPEIDLRMRKGTHHRKTSAALHKLAAAVELATPVGEGWRVQIESSESDDAGRVYLELMKGDRWEVERATAVLEKAAEVAL